MKKAHPLLIAPATFLFFACGESPAPPQIGTLTQAVRAGASEGGEVFVGADLLVTETSGEAVPCGEGEVQFSVEVSRNGEAGPYEVVDEARVYRACSSPSQGQLALVVDNSQSLETQLDDLKSAAQRVSDHVIDRGGRVSLTRVSTNARVLSPLSDDPEQLTSAIDDMFVSNGWTALYDGVRMAGETLGQARQDAQVQSFEDATAFCNLGDKRGILAFTDSAENNSGHQSHWSAEYPGDGIDTTLDDLMQLEVDGSATPIYTVGLGESVDHGALSRLAAASGGRHVPLDASGDVEDVLAMLATYGASTHQICAALPDHVCGSLQVRIHHRFDDGENVVEGSTTKSLELPCPTRANGRVVTLLLTLNASDMQSETVRRLVAQTVNWASPVDAPRVLFVRDDFHHGEFAEDTGQLYETLRSSGYVTELMDEPSDGLRAEQLEGFDVVWFSNPGYPMDDVASFHALTEFSQAGGGVVLQGDDMSWSHGKAFSLQPLTGLSHEDNGTRYCGTRIDNGRGGTYAVSFDGESHPLTTGLEGSGFLYGDDIDTVRLPEVPAEGSTLQVLATARVDGDDDCNAKPVIVAHTPPQAE